MSNKLLENCEKQTEDSAFVKAVEQGLLEVQEGKTLPLDEVKKRLGIK